MSTSRVQRQRNLPLVLSGYFLTSRSASELLILSAASHRFRNSAFRARGPLGDGKEPSCAIWAAMGSGSVANAIDSNDLPGGLGVAANTTGKHFSTPVAL